MGGAAEQVKFIEKQREEAKEEQGGGERRESREKGAKGYLCLLEFEKHRVKQFTHRTVNPTGSWRRAASGHWRTGPSEKPAGPLTRSPQEKNKGIAITAITRETEK